MSVFGYVLVLLRIFLQNTNRPMVLGGREEGFGFSGLVTRLCWSRPATFIRILVIFSSPYTKHSGKRTPSVTTGHNSVRRYNTVSTTQPPCRFYVHVYRLDYRRSWAKLFPCVLVGFRSRREAGSVRIGKRELIIRGRKRTRTRQKRLSLEPYTWQ